jgi:hypothetical protein
MNNLNVTDLSYLLLLIKGLREIYSKSYQRVWFDTPILRNPSWQSLQILPESYIDRLEETWGFMVTNAETEGKPFVGFKDYEIQRLQRVIDFTKEGSKLDRHYVQQQKADFYRFFIEHDRRRGTGFIRTFPEMADFWKECEYYAKNT